MESEAGDFQDWELLNHTLDNSDSVLVNSPELKDPTKIDDFDDGVQGMIQVNYFSLDSQKTHVPTVSGPDVSEIGSVTSDHPSWIDPGLEARYPRKNSTEFWSDSSSERSDDRKFSDFEGKDEVGLVQNAKLQGASEEVQDIGVENEKDSLNRLSDLGGIGCGQMEVWDFEEISQTGRENENLRGESEVLGEGTCENESFEGDKEGQSDGIEVRNGEGMKKKQSLVWWKMPIELFKYCVFKVGPGWTFAVAAAFMGFVIFGRRLYKMKKKSRSLELKVTVDDKKISQFMSRAARLNEAFSVVKRVPVIRPSLPAVGVTHWPVVSLR